MVGRRFPSGARAARPAQIGQAAHRARGEPPALRKDAPRTAAQPPRSRSVRRGNALSTGNRDEQQEVAPLERTAFAVRRNAKAFRSWVASEPVLWRTHRDQAKRRSRRFEAKLRELSCATPRVTPPLRPPRSAGGYRVESARCCRWRRDGALRATSDPSSTRSPVPGGTRRSTSRSLPR